MVTSVSSGSMFALVLVAVFQLDIHKLVGTDLVQAAILLSFTASAHLSLGTIDLKLSGFPSGLGLCQECCWVRGCAKLPRKRYYGL